MGKERIMKKLIVILLIISMFLTGCGIFDLNKWTVPQDTEFIELVNTLNTPEKICNYMQDNFTYQYHSLYAPSPYKLWLTKNGDCNDFATFGIFIANYHGYETYTIKVYYKNTFKTHLLGVYVEDMLSFSENWIYRHGYDNFRDIVIYDMRFRPPDWTWESYKVYDFDNTLIEKGVIE